MCVLGTIGSKKTTVTERNIIIICFIHRKTGNIKIMLETLFSLNYLSVVSTKFDSLRRPIGSRRRHKMTMKFRSFIAVHIGHRVGNRFLRTIIIVIGQREIILAVN